MVFLKDISYAHQDYIYLKYTVDTVKLWHNIEVLK